MFDTMTMTKIVGGGCGALLVFLLGKWAAELVYETEGGHGAEQQAYVVPVEDSSAPAEEAPEVDFATLMENADAGAGERVFNKCRACHKVNGENAVGPHLNGVVGREVDSVPDYTYSGALEEVVDVWTPEHIFNFIEDPQGYAPGTKMGFAGLDDPEDRADVIAFLQTKEG